MQRLRIRFCRGGELRFISHLDLMRLWQRALTRAGINLAYSEGYSPHPRLSIAAPLALGVTSRAELMDVFLEKWASPHFFTDAVNQQLPEGIRVLEAHQIPPILPSLQSRMSFAEYEVKLETEQGREEISGAIADLLSREELPWQHQRDTGPRKYDLRKLIDDIRLEALVEGVATLVMKLRCDSGGSGRPEQVAAALGFAHPPQSIARTNLILTT
ncbi:MAG: TIGR03936 family radical SAM-associated protein [Chloroflexota bacterium]